MSYNPNGPRNNTGMSNYGTPGSSSLSSTRTDFETETTEESEGLRAKAEHLASNVKDKASQLGSQVSEKASQLGSQVQDKASQFGSQVHDKASAAMSSVSEKFSDMAGAVREHVPAAVAPYAERAADTLERAGSYLKEHDLGEFMDDVTGLIRRHPMPAMLTGVALGFLLARNTRR